MLEKTERLPEEQEKDFINQMNKHGYENVRFIEGRGYCGMQNFIFTRGLIWGLNQTGFMGRWCYPKHLTVIADTIFSLWDGKSDPVGPWVKYKGVDGEYSKGVEIL